MRNINYGRDHLRSVGRGALMDTIYTIAWMIQAAEGKVDCNCIQQFLENQRLDRSWEYGAQRYEWVPVIPSDTCEFLYYTLCHPIHAKFSLVVDFDMDTSRWYFWWRRSA
ncbi:MAG: hypothetical protein PVF58_20580 [Candidatus Methanofastidiosia archaeon]|jgi:hypothetical protein